MVFSVYVLRDDPDYAIFDVQLYNPPVGERHEYDCAAVFDLQKGAFFWQQDGSCIIGVIDDWRLHARQVLCSEFTDRDSGVTVPIKRLWPD